MALGLQVYANAVTTLDELRQAITAGHSGHYGPQCDTGGSAKGRITALN